MRVTRRLLALLAAAWFGVCGAEIAGKKPGYLVFGASSVPSEQAITRAIWAPGLEDGYVPQGVSIDGGYVLVSGYRSTDPKVDKGPCRVFRIEVATGRDAGSFDLPEDCGHAGGLANLGGGLIVAADTRRLYRINLEKAIASGNAAGGLTATLKLGGELKASFVAFDGTDLWAGSSEKDASKAKLHRLPLKLFDELDGKTVREDKAATVIAIPAEAQGAAFDKSGVLWLTSSSSRQGTLYRLDRTNGSVLGQHDLVIGVEGLEFDADGRLWTVSEAGSQRWIKWSKSYPVVFQMDVSKLK